MGIVKTLYIEKICLISPKSVMRGYGESSTLAKVWETNDRLAILKSLKVRATPQRDLSTVVIAVASRNLTGNGQGRRVCKGLRWRLTIVNSILTIVSKSGLP